MNNLNNLKVIISSTMDECKVFSQQWNELIECSDANYIFSTFEWVSSWWEAFGKNKELAVILVFDNNYLIGIMPLAIYRGNCFEFFARKVEFIGSPFSDYNNFIIKSGRETEVLKLFFEAIYKMEGKYDFISLSDLANNTKILNILNMCLVNQNKSFYGDHQYYPIIDLDSNYNDYFKNLSKNLKEQIIRRSRKLSKMGELKLAIAREESEVSNFMNSFSSLYTKKAFARKKNFAFLHNDVMNFYRIFSKRILTKGWLHLSVLFLNKTPISIHLGFVYKNRFYWYAPVFNEQFRSFSPGVVHLNYLIQECFNQKYDVFDFLRGEEKYKIRWSNNQTSTHSFLISGETIKKKTIFFLLRKKKQISTSGISSFFSRLNFYKWKLYG